MGVLDRLRDLFAGQDGPDDVIGWGGRYVGTAQEHDDGWDDLPPLDEDEVPPLTWTCYRCTVGGDCWTVDQVMADARNHARTAHPGVRMRIEEED